MRHQEMKPQPQAMPTKAMLLAAGKGTRLHPLTETVPKCMVPIGGKPLLEHNVEWLKRYGVTDLVINLHHLPEALTAHFGDGSKWGVRITYSPETELLGTAGSVKRLADFFEDSFLVWYGDNLSTCRLDKLWRQHCEKNGLATIALFEREDATGSGIVGLEDDDRITRFLEKPRADQLFSTWVNAGVMALEPQVLEWIPAQGMSDFGRDVFPALLARQLPLYGYRMSPDEGLWWIDTPDDLERAQAALARETRLREVG
jgi:NDP-sugar pyrophosphorylase family protein